DGRSDLYSFGVVLYNLLTGADPFAGESPREIITAQLFQPPRPLPPNIPEPVQRVVLRALEKDPNDRYADAAEFMAAVEEAFDLPDARPARPLPTTAIDKTVVSAPPTVVERPSHRWRWVALAAFALIIL